MKRGLPIGFTVGLMGLLLMGLLGCNAVTPTPTPLPATPTTIPPATPIATVVEMGRNSATLIEVGNYITRLAWSEDSETLTYNLGTDEGDQNRLYHVVTAEVEEVDDQEAYNPAFPMETGSPVLSPNQVNAIKVSQQEDLTFEISLESPTSNAVLYQTDCHVAVYWTSDSRYAVIRPILEPNCEDTIQVIDAEDGTITEIVELSAYTSLLWQWMEFSATHNLVLYEREGSGYLYNLETGENILVTNDNGASIGWMAARTSEQILVGRQGDNQIWTIEQIETQTKEVTSIDGLEDIALLHRFTGQGAISPDGKWLALVGYSSEERKTALYLLPLP